MSKGSDKKRKIILVEFAKKVRQRRYELGLTQEALAEKADFHVNYVGGIERAERNPSLTSIVILAKALGCPAKDLMPS
ncbi:MAG: helix-turn-helix transcriptional regulator [Chlamydiota bacterium]